MMANAIQMALAAMKFGVLLSSVCAIIHAMLAGVREAILEAKNRKGLKNGRRRTIGHRCEAEAHSKLELS